MITKWNTNTASVLQTLLTCSRFTLLIIAKVHCIEELLLVLRLDPELALFSSWPGEELSENCAMASSVVRIEEPRYS